MKLKVRVGPFRPWVPRHLAPDYPPYQRIWTDGERYLQWPSRSFDVEPAELKRVREVFA